MLVAMKEEWRPVVGYDGLYSVSSLGSVRRDVDQEGRPAPRLLRGQPVRGYLLVALSKAGFSKRYVIHRLVAVAFLGPIPDGMQVNHKNQRRGDNRLDNLEYTTASENIKHTYRMGRTPLRGDMNGRATITDAQALTIRSMFAEGVWQAEIGRRLSVSKWTVFNVIHRKTWAHL